MTRVECLFLCSERLSDELLPAFCLGNLLLDGLNHEGMGTLAGSLGHCHDPALELWW